MKAVGAAREDRDVTDVEVICMHRLWTNEYIIGKMHRVSLQVCENPGCSPISSWCVVIHVWGMRPGWFLHGGTRLLKLSASAHARYFFRVSQ